MAKKSPPKYRGPHTSGLGYVFYKGKRHYFKGAPYGSDESRRMYYQWLADNIGQEPPPSRNETTIYVGDLCQAFIEYALQHYKESSTELTHFRMAIAYIMRCGLQKTRVDDFGPLKFQEVRDLMVADDKWNITTINQEMQRVKRIFKWGVSRELVPTDVLVALNTVDGLREGRTTARPRKTVVPVDEFQVFAAISVASPTLRAMIHTQYLTGMRSDNIVRMKPEFIDQREEVWIYTPDRHKSQSKGKALVIPLGRRVQHILLPFFDRPADQWLFSPREAARWKSGERRRTAKTKRKSRATSSFKHLKDRYDSQTYRKAIIHACRLAQIPQWHPHQLRHNVATRLRSLHGIEAARIYLGHSHVDTTTLYAETDLTVAIEIARESC